MGDTYVEKETIADGRESVRLFPFFPFFFMFRESPGFRGINDVMITGLKYERVFLFLISHSASLAQMPFWNLTTVLGLIARAGAQRSFTQTPRTFNDLVLICHQYCYYEEIIAGGH